MPTEKYIKYNGSYTVLLSCDPAKHGKVNIKESVYVFRTISVHLFR